MLWVIVFLVVVAIAATYVIIRMRDAARAEKALRRPAAPDDDQEFLREVQDKLLRDERDRDRGERPEDGLA
ncbi:hypothetical protein [Dietzia timorensis]|uniref:Uncharacterized protein n=1 Tax=Dietzia timorensis TaxID=499555 RepID=A0A173LM10_9ACTN|nr:hypothetical protein [Dietzia timorensis]ANI93315.1 Hypothetical protein BJL86_2555 [Dietzia timorensis]